MLGMEMENCDRLSELPDSLIFNIFRYLPVKEVVRSSLLSKSFENLWTTCPHLDFEVCTCAFDTDRIRNFVNRALMMWRGMRIQRFRICLADLSDKSLYGDIDLWLRFATEHQVQELDLDLQYVSDRRKGVYPPIQEAREELYWAPYCLYSCPSLQTLSLRRCNLHIPNKNVTWNQLKHLRIESYEVSEDLIDRVLSGCPQLEFFTVSLLESHHNLCIRSTSLKSLFICKFIHSSYREVVAPSTETELRIWTPNLQLLDLFGIPHAKFSMNYAPSLTRANLEFDSPWYQNHKFLSENLGGTLEQILPTIQHAQQLSLSRWCVKALVAMKNKNMFSSPLPNVNLLELRHCYDLEILMHLLGMFPELERLVVQRELFPKKKWLCNTPVRFVEANLPDSLLKQLRTIVIVWGGPNKDDFIFPFIEILLKYASKLEKMEFQFKGTGSSNNLVSALKKLLPNLPDSSFSLNHSYLVTIFFQSSLQPTVD